MKGSPSTYPTFLVVGLLSGIASGVSVAIPPLGLFCPPVFFGVAICCAFHATQTPISFWQCVLLICVSVVAFFAAVIGAMLAVRLPGFDNGFLGGGRSGAIAGGIGSFLIALGLIVIVEDSKPVASLPIMTLAGSVLGVVFAALGIALSDHPACGHPLDDLVIFPIWQAGVALTIPLFRRNPP